MCWKRYEPDPPPSPTPMAFFGASTEGYGAANATEGGARCPDEATLCPNITNPHMPVCYQGFCCERGNDQFCSCLTGWEGDECDTEEFINIASSIQDSSNSMALIIVLTVLILLVGLLTVIFLVYRRRRTSHPNSGPQELASRVTVTVVQNSTPLLQQHGDTNGNDKVVRT